MTHIRRPLVGLVVLFAAAVTLDRIGLGQREGTAIAAWVYLLAAALVALPFLFGGLRRAPAWSNLLLALIAYTSLKILLPGGPGTESFSPHIAATETGFVTAATLLVHRLAAGLDRLDDTLATIGVGDYAAAPLEGPQATNEILAEMARSRRHDRPLSVTVVEPGEASFDLAVDRAGEDLERALRTRFVRGRLARAIDAQLRRSDLLFEHPESGRFVILSPETDTAGVELLVRRVREAAVRVGLDLQAGTASFPVHAISFDQLIESAEAHLAGRFDPGAATLRPVEHGGGEA
jgi:hypothetical protein